ncbi:MAG: NAD(P)H-dependent oxidoreductase [Spirochaetia bacterium]|nr:NAD(P)H-dependent oxidoreductase [Spirochaetia bacterium]
MSKTLIAYFSAGGNTAYTARMLAQQMDADIYSIKPVQKYTPADLDWQNPNSRSSVEMNDPTSRPEIIDGEIDLSQYDTVCLGFPIWWYVAPHAVNTFIEKNNFSGKKVILFATSGGSEITKALDTMRAQYPRMNIVGGKMLNGKVEPGCLDF